MSMQGMKSDDISNARVNQIVGAKVSETQTVNNFADFMALFENLFQRTVTDEDK